MQHFSQKCSELKIFVLCMHVIFVRIQSKILNWVSPIIHDIKLRVPQKIINVIIPRNKQWTRFIITRRWIYDNIAKAKIQKLKIKHGNIRLDYQIIHAYNEWNVFFLFLELCVVEQNVIKSMNMDSHLLLHYNVYNTYVCSALLSKL